MEAVAMGLSIVGGIVGAFEGITAASKSNRQLESNARSADLNSNIARQNADLEARRRERELATSRRKFNMTRGDILSQSSALGLLGGSVGDLISDADTQQNVETVAIKDERNSSIAGSLNQANAYSLEASSLRAGKSSGIWGAVGSLISGFGGAAKMAIK